MKLLSALLLVICLICASCTGSARSNSAALEPGIAGSQLAARLPDVFSIDQPRDPAALFTTSIAGFQAEIVSGGTEKDGYKMALDGGGNPAWAIARFNGLSTEPSIYIQARMNISDVNTDVTYYRMMADYEAGRWDVKAINPQTTEAGINLLPDFDPARHISENGNTFVGLLTAAQPVTLDIIFFDVDATPLPPQNLQAVGSEDGGSIELSWELPQQLDTLSLYAKESSQTDDDYLLLLGNVDDLSAYTHDAGDFVLPCQYGVDYDYRMTATIGGEESEPTGVVTARRELPAPELRVSQGLYSKRIVAYWEMPVEAGNLDYDVYRDDVLIAENRNFILSGGGYYDDFDAAVHDGEYYSYHVIARGSEGSSPPSVAVDGYASLITTQRLVSIDNLFDPCADVMYTAGFSSQPVIVYYDEGQGKLIYHKYNSDGFSVGVPVADTRSSLDVSGLSDFNRPWIAYNNSDDTIKAEGLWIARGQDDNPAAGEWLNYLLYPGDIIGEKLHMQFVDGGLAVIFIVRVSVGVHDVKYAYALNDDPQSADDWKVKDLLPAAASNFPDVMMLRQLDGLPLVAMAMEDELRLLRGTNSAPSGPANWDTVVLDPALHGDDDIDCIINDGIVSIALGGGQVEGTGDLRFYRCTGTDPLVDSFESWVLRSYDDENAEMFDLFYRDGIPHITVPHGVWSSATTYSLEGIDDPFINVTDLSYYYDGFDSDVSVRWFSRMFADSGVYRTAYVRSWDNLGENDWGIYVATNTPK